MQNTDTPEEASNGGKKIVREIYLQDHMKVLVFFRDRFPYFSLREFDGKILRAPSSEQRSLRIQGASEQAIRARITQAILKLKLRPIKANKEEIRYLKKKGVLGKRAPKCSLLTCGDMSRLLKSFGCHADAALLVAAVRKLDCEQGSPLHPVIETTASSSDRPPKTGKSKRSIAKEFPNGKTKKKKAKKNKKNNNLAMHKGQHPIIGHNALNPLSQGSYLWQGVLPPGVALPHGSSTSIPLRSYPLDDLSRGAYPSAHNPLSPPVSTPPLPSYLSRESPSSSTSTSPSPRISSSPASDDSRDSSIPLTPLSAVTQSTYGSPNTERFFFSPIAHKTRPIDHQVYLLSPVQMPPTVFTKVSQADEAYLAMCSTLQPLG